MGLTISGVSLTPFKQNTSSTLTGTTAETIISSFLIPAGTFQANDWVEIIGALNSTPNFNIKTIRCYFNSTSSLSGATLYRTRILENAVSQTFAGMFFFKNSLTSIRTFVGPSLNARVDWLTTGTGVDLAIDFSVDQYLIISGQLNVGTDEIILNGLTSLIRR